MPKPKILSKYEESKAKHLNHNIARSNNFDANEVKDLNFILNSFDKDIHNRIIDFESLLTRTGRENSCLLEKILSSFTGIQKDIVTLQTMINSEAKELTDKKLKLKKEIDELEVTKEKRIKEVKKAGIIKKKIISGLLIVTLIFGGLYGYLMFLSYKEIKEYNYLKDEYTKLYNSYTRLTKQTELKNKAPVDYSHLFNFPTTENSNELNKISHHSVKYPETNTALEIR